ncbi:MAG TPA: signal peptidase I [Gaiellaceae bacterium]|nr:signal peptidase I [Gaiellaceae bacterium]
MRSSAHAPALGPRPALSLVPPAAPEPAPPVLRTAFANSWRALRIALQLGMLAAWLWWGLPQTIGGRADWVMVSGWSMEPRYHTGDLVLVDRQSSYHAGQVIAYRVPKGDVGAGSVVIHRIVGGDGETGFTVQGDNRTAPDLWHPKTSDVIGAKTLRVPHAFAVVKWLHSPLLLGLLASFVVFAKVAFSAAKDEAATGEDGS